MTSSEYPNYTNWKVGYSQHSTLPMADISTGSWCGLVLSMQCVMGLVSVLRLHANHCDTSLTL